MVGILSKEVTEICNDSFVIGKQVLDILTSGMYDNPLMVYREYIQNSVDSIDQAYELGLLLKGQEKLDVWIDGLSRTITIIDNGIGVKSSDIEKVLLSIGFSGKEGTHYRGFRGIGRLGGLGYCQKLIFETKSSGDDLVAIVEFSQDELNDVLSYNDELTLYETIELLSNISYREKRDGEGEHFFKVRMEDVKRFHTDVLMDIAVVRNYLSQVAPTPYNVDKFHFAVEIEKQFSSLSGYSTYEISVNGEQVFRPYQEKFTISKDLEDRISDVKFFSINDSQGNIIGKGWFAISGFFSSLPPSSICRGIRVRQGNIEVGDEYFLSKFFSERRFATWQIGEIQIVSNSLKTNARRDGFEHTDNYQTFLERIGLLGRHLSKLCRDASKNRASKIRAKVIIDQVKNSFNGKGIFLNEEHFKSALLESREKVEQIKSQIEYDSFSKEILEGIETCDKLLNSFSPPSTYLRDLVNGQLLNGKTNKKIIEEFISSLVLSYNKSGNSNDLIQKILQRYLKKNSSEGVELITIGLEAI